MLKSRHHCLLVLFAMAAAVPAAAIAAPPDPQPPRQPSALDDDDMPRVRPAVHYVAPTEQDRELAALRAEVQRLRAHSAMCHDVVAGKLSAAAAPPGK